METATYSYKAADSRAGDVLFLLFVASVCGLLYWDGAFWWQYLLVTVPAALTLKELGIGRLSTLSVTSRELQFCKGQRRRAYAFPQIASVLLDYPSGKLEAYLRLTDGSLVNVPAACLPPRETLVEVLAQHGIQLENHSAR